MKISFSPQFRDEALAVHRSGDTLTINGAICDFSGVTEGQPLPRAEAGCDWLAAPVERVDGELHVTLILPIGPDAPEARRYPQPVEMTEDGPVPLPAGG